MKLRYLFIAVLFALLVSVWAARTQLAEVAAASVMQRSGVSDVTVSIRQLDPGQSQIERLAFSLENESGVLQLEAHGVRISYNPRATGRGPRGWHPHRQAGAAS